MKIRIIPILQIRELSHQETNVIVGYDAEPGFKSTCCDPESVSLPTMPERLLGNRKRLYTTLKKKIDVHQFRQSVSLGSSALLPSM